MSVEPQLRSVRAGVFTSVCVGVSAGGHAMTSAHELPVAGPLVGGLLVFAFAWAAAGRERGFATILGWMLWGQLALHLVFSFVQGAGSSYGAPMHGMAAGLPAAVADDPADHGSGLAMIAAHIVAALVSAWWLRRGEAALFALLRLVAALLLPVLLLLVPAPGPIPGPILWRRAKRCGRDRTVLFLRHVVVLRGPPVPLAA
ncbi:hypothetical protein [Nocardiopsis ansamitocini]|uniref:Uncharacterized protein n=1 Tax=Nocardiopsis ansamitocini TaxID=1670832 RepID=A0A9W6UH71_9ACTN|nr:hypothetical protein [Nocardiopsis ansamitocini]GLU45665.1 hypothetical protein Nans01_00160 [Nocardiopsis ansamitocini]